MKKALIIIGLIAAALGTSYLPIKAEASHTAPFNLPNATKIKVYPALGTDILKITFSNLIFARKISYELTYNHSGGSEGVVGEFSPRRVKFVVKVIDLGTCSSGGTCVPHENLSNMKLKVTTKYFLFNRTETVIYTIL